MNARRSGFCRSALPHPRVDFKLTHFRQPGRLRLCCAVCSLAGEGRSAQEVRTGARTKFREPDSDRVTGDTEVHLDQVSVSYLPTSIGGVSWLQRYPADRKTDLVSVG